MSNKMTEREALKQALDYIVESNKNSQFWLVPTSNLNKTVNAIKETLAQPEQEPVAFDVKCDACKGSGLDWDDNNYKCVACHGSGFVEKLLYTTPPQPEQEPDCDKDPQGCWSVRCQLGNKCKKLYTTPPQRTWVGLTKKEVYDLYESDYEVFHQRIEAKLKQKNGYAEEKNT